MLSPRSDIRKSFSKAAPSYKLAANHQFVVADALLELVEQHMKDGILTEEIKKSHQILDVGSGTGFVSDSAEKRGVVSSCLRLDISEAMLKQDPAFPESEMLNSRFCCGDLQQLPFKNESLALMLSSYAFQWSNDLNALFAELNRVLKPGASVYFSIPGKRTFEELKEAWTTIDDEVHVHDFADQDSLLSVAHIHNFDCLHFSQKLDLLAFDKQKQALAHIKNIGAHNLDKERRKTLLGKEHYFAFSNAFKKRSRIEARYSLTYQTYFFAFRKKAE